MDLSADEFGGGRVLWLLEFMFAAVEIGSYQVQRLLDFSPVRFVVANVDGQSDRWSLCHCQLRLLLSSAAAVILGAMGITGCLCGTVEC